MSERAMVTVRPVEAGDEAEWRRLSTGYLDFYESSVAETVHEDACAAVQWTPRHYRVESRRLRDRITALTTFVAFRRVLS
ncbi:hypothetical protein [Tropicimonas sp. IMCC6043]|uniref:hypothetical protein n=1 Tax=Tropicimonas sp. IMCC6043 TaxID=2510645 RepID=UPI0013EC6C57|nr:hypothetical protein [Tropicimonas sp. IMCC6043]